MGMVRGKFGGTVILLALAGCSLTTSLRGLSEGDVDVAPDTGPGDPVTGDARPGDPPPNDGGLLQDVTTTVVDGCSPTGCFEMPEGFSLVAFGATAKGTTCPTGFGGAADTVEGPAVGQNACTCLCNVTSQPSCATGTILGFYGGGGAGTCPTAGGNLANDGCGTDGFLGPFDPGNEHRFTPPAKTGGTCAAAADKDESKLTYAAQGRVCLATTIPKCGTKVCPPAVAGPFGACIASDGDVACPSAFPKKHLLGSDATFTCSAGCTCSGVTATCKGKLNYYASTNCSGAVAFDVLVNNTCQDTNANGASFGSHKYFPDPPMNVACTKAGSTTPSAPALANKTTVCCN